MSRKAPQYCEKTLLRKRHNCVMLQNEFIKSRWIVRIASRAVKRRKRGVIMPFSNISKFKRISWFVVNFNWQFTWINIRAVFKFSYNSFRFYWVCMYLWVKTRKYATNVKPSYYGIFISSSIFVEIKPHAICVCLMFVRRALFSDCLMRTVY